jgi:hypothetical protein
VFPVAGDNTGIKNQRHEHISSICHYVLICQRAAFDCKSRDLRVASGVASEATLYSSAPCAREWTTFVLGRAGFSTF